MAVLLHQDHVHTIVESAMPCCNIFCSVVRRGKNRLVLCAVEEDLHLSHLLATPMGVREEALRRAADMAQGASMPTVPVRPTILSKARYS